MELTTLADVIARIDISELGSGYDQEDLDEMTLRDLRAIAALPASSNIPAPKTALVIEAIKANPMAGDREIARLVGCSAMTVGRTRAKLGAKLDVRNFTRGGKVYTMRERRRNEKPLAGSADIGGVVIERRTG
jgi:hypothetical protein